MAIEYQGIRVEIPFAWERLDDCEYPAEHWGAPDSAACGGNEGVYLVGSATYDPDRGPGVRRAERDDASDGWAGYVYVGELAVYAADRDRDVVETLLDSARVTAN